MSEPVAPSIPVRMAMSESKPAGGQQGSPRLPLPKKQQNATAAQQVATFSHRLKVANDRIDIQQCTIAELQDHDEENRQVTSLISLRVDTLEKKNGFLRATLEMVTKSPDIDLNNLVRTSDLAGTSTPNHTGSLTSEEEGQVAKIIKAAFLRLYGVTKFNPRALRGPKLIRSPPERELERRE